MYEDQCLLKAISYQINNLENKVSRYRMSKIRINMNKITLIKIVDPSTSVLREMLTLKVVFISTSYCFKSSES